MNAPAVTVPMGEDFPDWINPFVVKELRQGLHSRIFVGVFVALHAFVAAAMMLGFAMAQTQDTPFQLTQTMQWVVEASCVCVLLPVGGYAAVAGELKADSLELIRVAGVSSGQIVFGKWQAQLCLATMLLISVSPYHLLQYYLNHASPLSQIAALFSCWLISLLITSMMMFYATLNAGGRIGCLVFGLPLMLFMLGVVLAPAAAMIFGAGPGSIVGLIMETVITAGGLLFFLSLTVSGMDMRVRALPQFAIIPPPEPGKKDYWI